MLNLVCFRMTFKTLPNWSRASFIPWCVVSNYYSPVMVNWYLTILNTSSDLVVYANYNPSDCLMLSDHYIVCHLFIPTVRNIFATYKRPLDECQMAELARCTHLCTHLCYRLWINKRQIFFTGKIMIPILKQKWLCFGKFYVENV